MMPVIMPAAQLVGVLESNLGQRLGSALGAVQF